jgi:outer membrane lipoprotein SlyB
MYLAKTIFMVTLALALTGCAQNSRFGPQTTVVNHYPDCYEPIREMRGAEFMVEESTVGGAVAGALLGALAGYAVDGGRGALIGATMGAVTGGIIANQFAKAAEEKNNARRLELYSRHLLETSGQMDATTAAASLARQCYDQQFAAAVQEFQAGNITREQFRSRYIETAAGLEEASRVLGTSIDALAEASVAYEGALQKESARLQVKEEVIEEIREVARQETKASTGQTSPRPPARRPDTGLNKEEDQKLNDMVLNGAALENAVDNARAEQDLINAKLDLTNQVAADLLS